MYHARNLYSLTIENSWSLPDWASIDFGSVAKMSLLTSSDLTIVELNHNGDSYNGTEGIVTSGLFSPSLSKFYEFDLAGGNFDLDTSVIALADLIDGAKKLTRIDLHDQTGTRKICVSIELDHGTYGDGVIRVSDAESGKVLREKQTNRPTLDIDNDQACGA